MIAIIIGYINLKTVSFTNFNVDIFQIVDDIIV